MEHRSRLKDGILGRMGAAGLAKDAAAGRDLVRLKGRDGVAALKALAGRVARNEPGARREGLRALMSLRELGAAKKIPITRSHLDFLDPTGSLGNRLSRALRKFSLFGTSAPPWSGRRASDMARGIMSNIVNVLRSRLSTEDMNPRNLIDLGRLPRDRKLLPDEWTDVYRRIFNGIVNAPVSKDHFVEDLMRNRRIADVFRNTGLSLARPRHRLGSIPFNGSYNLLADRVTLYPLMGRNGHSFIDVNTLMHEVGHRIDLNGRGARWDVGPSASPLSMLKVKRPAKYRGIPVWDDPTFLDKIHNRTEALRDEFAANRLAFGPVGAWPRKNRMAFATYLLNELSRVPEFLGPVRGISRIRDIMGRERPNLP